MTLRRGSGRAERGSVLVVALFVLVAVSFVVLTLARDARVELQVSGRAAEDLQARALVDSAVDRAIAALKLDDTAHDTLRDPWRDDEASFRAVPLGAGKYWIAFGEPDPGDGRELRYGIQDESAKLNVNVASRDQLLFLPQMTEEIADAILDWRDGDDDARDFGAESSFYNSLDPGYNAKNAPIESLEELLRIRGIDEAVLWGEDRNRNGLLDPGEDDGDASFPPDDANGTLQRGLADYLTVYSLDQNETRDAKARTNLRNANPNELRDLLVQGGMAGDLANRVRLFAQQRRGNFVSVADLLDVPGMDETGFAIAADLLTTIDAPRIPGRVNVNTARKEVLMGLPGLAEDDVQAILSRRASAAEDLASPAWLLRVLTVPKMKAVFDSVTTTSWQFTIHAAAAIDAHPSVVRRVEVVVDRAYQPTRIIWRQDLTALGFPLPNERGEGHP